MDAFRYVSFAVVTKSNEPSSDDTVTFLVAALSVREHPAVCKGASRWRQLDVLLKTHRILSWLCQALMAAVD